MIGPLLVIGVVAFLAWEVYAANQAGSLDVQPSDINPFSSSALPAMADAIRQFEGWFPGSVSQRNNNPGNLRSPVPGQIGTDSRGFAKFATAADGYAALIAYIQRQAAGDLYTGMGPSTTLAEFFSKYAPSSDSNNPDQYAQFVAGKMSAALGIPVTLQTTLGDIAA